MQLNLTTLHAIHFLLHIATNPGRHSATEIAMRTNVTRAFTRKILGQLEKAGLIKGSVGRSGGYTLLKAPEHITLKEIIEIVEGPLFVVPTFSPENSHMLSQHPHSQTHEFFCKVQAHTDQMMERHYLSDVLLGRLEPTG